MQGLGKNTHELSAGPGRALDVLHLQGSRAGSRTGSGEDRAVPDKRSLSGLVATIAIILHSHINGYMAMSTPATLFYLQLLLYQIIKSAKEFT
jgi:hypothetical protein